MGPLAVVDPKPSVGQGAQFRQGFEEVRIQHLGPVAPINGLPAVEIHGAGSTGTSESRGVPVADDNGKCSP